MAARLNLAQTLPSPRTEGEGRLISDIWPQRPTV